MNRQATSPEQVHRHGSFRKFRWIAWLVFLSAALLAPRVTGANTIRVPADYPNIQAAIGAAVSGDSVVVAPGTYSGPGNRDIVFGGRNIAVLSESGRDETIIDCGGTPNEPHGGFTFSHQTSDAVLSGFTIRNAYGTEMVPKSALGCHLGNPRVERCRFEGNTGIFGAGMALSDHGMKIDDCEFIANSGFMGAGLCASGQNTVVTRCHFIGNHATKGAGVGNEESTARVTFNECTFIGNIASGRGGGIAWEVGYLSLQNCTIYGNEAPEGAGIHFLRDQYSLQADVSNTIVAFNRGESIFCISREVNLTCCDLFGNSAGDWIGCIADQQGAGGNFAGDPLFCDASAGDFRIGEASPCAPQHSGGCGLIGALPVGCGATIVQPTTWGALKHAFRR